MKEKKKISRSTSGFEIRGSGDQNEISPYFKR